MLGHTKSPYLDAQIYHETREHHTDVLHSGLRTDQVIKHIESSDTPSKKYKSAMKDVFVEELQSSLNDYKQKKLTLNQRDKDFNRSYLQDCELNGLKLDSTQLNRKQYYDKINRQQKDRAGAFVDDSKMHDWKVQKFVETQLDPQKFHHFQNKYDSLKPEIMRDYIKTLEEQKNQIHIQRSLGKINKENEVELRMKMSEHIKRLNNMEKMQRVEEKLNYRRDLQSMIQTKAHDNKTRDTRFYEKAQRHNPITNPIEFHIDNPYIVKKLANRLDLKHY